MSVLVIGAGAAGLAAARALHQAGIRAVVLEAANYVGGRMKTDSQYVNFPLELGAEFIHGDGAVTHTLLKQAGLSTIPVDRYGNLWWASSPGQPAQLYTQLDAATAGSIRTVFDDKAAVEHGEFEPDVSLAQFLRSRGRSEAEVAIADVLLCQTNNARVDQLSCADWKHEHQVDTAGDGEARVKEGYTHFLQWLQEGLTIHLEAAVERIRWGPAGVTCQTTSGAEFQGAACIITTSLAALQRGAIHFQPPLPEDKVQALHALHMLPATKLIYHFKRQLWPDDLTYMNHDGAAPRWWTPAYNRPGADAVITSFITAERAAAIDAMGEQQALEVGLQELSGLLGLELQQCREQLVKACRVSWASVPHIWGGYSSCPPGAHPMRFVLAAPTQDVLFWAGEATAHNSNPQTVHGAMDSGTRAAAECAQAVQRRSLQGGGVTY